MKALKGLAAKLKGQAGESLVETLVSILIIALASAVLATAAVVSVRINRRADESAARLYAAQTAAAERTAHHDGRVNVEITGSGVADGTVIFNVSYTGEDGAAAYFAGGDAG